MEKPILAEVWRLHSLAEAKSGDKDALRKALSESTYLNEAVSPFLDLEANDLFEVTEGEYSGTSCYLIDIKDGNFLDKLKYAFSAGMKAVEGVSGQKKFEPGKLVFDSVSFKQYISKKDYLPLNSATEIRARYPLEQPIGKTNEMNIHLVKNDSWVFQKQEIAIPKETETAVPVNNEEEAKNILFGDLINIQRKTAQ
jgi:hypothetical protein